ncbi:MULTISPECIES: ABC transporter permease subunit [unclassified Undibacterium]|uniref:ABC transporter permease subunit n=1 Tax=unclassified Undibacterium TaxID=2630295 RepID=UPI002AC9CA89|nr:MULTISPECIES: ABC transporter ATP-binding protein [unclassified Undibacterium]MEB0137541.1 ABC transporter ATP-binding protein [Undibacterium sp. CCC2.1]MEB0170542.1 ABC transporter ATP-binding protein [Undibacterium sp. CCC1.1]MEB0174483.1 ABC transporter ATP-binding protein [Undibacterium sp. CCC3.4]MEB0213720.1 ABC transporter ATP-binding protein [Undibacterium sp. 5I2]WPX43885.1 ABC transporter ATP-binding protein [Undibacterium sp. CCC3.4]
MSTIFDVKANPKKAYTSFVMLGIVLVLFPFIAANFGNSWVRIIDFALLYIMLALGLNIVVGFAGLLDLGYIAFYAVGAYLAAILGSQQFAVILESFIDNYPALGHFLVAVCGPEITKNGLHLSVWVIVPLSAALAGLFGALLGAPTLKLRGDYLAIVTLGFGEIIRIFMNNMNSPVNFTNGPQGINMIDPIRVFGVSLGGEAGTNATVDFGWFTMPSVNAYYFLFLALCIFIVFVSVRLQHSRLGRAWVAIREDEIAAKAMGLNTRNIKLLAFSMGASFGGVSGAMFASFQGFVSPESFSLMESIVILAMVVLGGIGHIPGVILGAILLAALPEVLRHIVEPVQMMLFGKIWIEAEVLRQLLYGLTMVVVMLNRPAGLWPAPKHEDRMAKLNDAAA